MINDECDKIFCKNKAVYEAELKKGGAYYGEVVFLCENCYKEDSKKEIVGNGVLYED